MSISLAARRVQVTYAAADPTAPSQVRTASFGGGAGTLALGPLELRLHEAQAPVGATGQQLLAWSLANRSGEPLRVRSAALVFAVAGKAPLRLFCHGYQSWSPSGVATLGHDRDPSAAADFTFLQSAYHADARTTADLRSEWVTVLAAANDPAGVLVGFAGGHHHDGILRLREGDEVELAAEAFLGEAVLGPGEQRELHALVLDTSDGMPAAKLAAWAALVGERAGARTSASYQVGWCSWYQYFHGVTEAHVRANLARAEAWPFEVFQVDDGYQAAIGDWLRTNERFPTSLDGLAATIAGAGHRPGLWLAPFLVAPNSAVARAHPQWLVRYREEGHDRGPLRAWWNEPWGGGDAGFMNALDTTHPEVQEHLEAVAAALVEAGFTYLKLDFTFAPSIEGGYHDPTRTPAERVRAGFDAVRRGASEDAFLLGCGVPLANVVGVIDGARIGQDVAPQWALDPAEEMVPGYLAVQPAVGHAHANTLARAFQHRRLWLNDPDCLLLRTADTQLTPAVAEAWARTVAVSGGMALVSDDLALLGARERALLAEVVATGRRCDAAAAAGAGPQCPDVLDRPLPTTLICGDQRIALDPATGEAWP